MPATMNKEMTTTTLDSKRIAPHPRPRPKILLAITGSVAAIKGPELAVTPPAPCYDPAIRQWRIKLVEPIPVNDIVTETYKVRID